MTKKRLKYQNPSTVKRFRGGEASKVRAMLKRLEKQISVKPNKSWVDPL